MEVIHGAEAFVEYLFSFWKMSVEVQFHSFSRSIVARKLVHIICR